MEKRGKKRNVMKLEETGENKGVERDVEWRTGGCDERL